MKEEIQTFVCNIKADVYKLFGDGVFIGLYYLAEYEKWVILHGLTLMFTCRFGLMWYDIYRRSKDVKKEAWQTQIKPILKADAARERRKSFWQKLLDIFKLMFFR